MSDTAPFPKIRTPDYPETHDRGYLSPKQKAELCLRQGGRCAGCGIKPRHGWEHDHVIELWEGGTNSADNWQAFGSSKDCKCHAKKSAQAAKRRAKMRRLRGETGQVKRRKERSGSLIKSRNTLSQPQLLATQTSVEPKRWSSPWKKPDDYVSPLSKRSKSYRKPKWGKA